MFTIISLNISFKREWSPPDVEVALELLVHFALVDALGHVVDAAGVLHDEGWVAQSCDVEGRPCVDNDKGKEMRSATCSPVNLMMEEVVSEEESW